MKGNGMALFHEVLTNKHESKRSFTCIVPYDKTFVLGNTHACESTIFPENRHSNCPEVGEWASENINSTYLPLGVHAQKS